MLLALVCLLFSASAVAADLDPGYAKAFGQPTIAASVRGVPALGKYDPGQFDYKDGVFLAAGGDDMTLDLRALLAPGTTVGKALAKTKKERGKNLKYHTGDFFAFRIWVSHDETGKDLVSAEAPWPKKLGDIPVFASPRVVQRVAVSGGQADWVGAMLPWSDLKADATSLLRLPKGSRIYITFHLGFEYKTPGGQIENKWDDVLHKWVQVKSTGLLGFEYGEPLAACTIAITGLQADPTRFKVDGDGIRDSGSGLLWATKADVKKRASGTPGEQNLAAYIAALGNGWRLPTRAELLALRKAGGEKPCEFFKSVGFVGVQPECYWTSEPGSGGGRIICITMAHEEYRQPVRDPVRHADGTDELPVWPVK